MTAPTNMALYRLLVKGGASEAEAEEAARYDASALVTKADLQAALFELETRLQRFILYAMLGMTAIFGGIVTLVKLLP